MRHRERVKLTGAAMPLLWRPSVPQCLGTGPAIVSSGQVLALSDSISGHFLSLTEIRTGAPLSDSEEDSALSLRLLIS